MTAQGNLGVRPSSAKTRDDLSVPNDGTEVGASKHRNEPLRNEQLRDGEPGDDARKPCLLERLLHNLMRALGAWTI